MLELSHTDASTYYFSRSPRETLLARLSWRSNSTRWSSFSPVSCSPWTTLESVSIFIVCVMCGWQIGKMENDTGLSLIPGLLVCLQVPEGRSLGKAHAQQVWLLAGGGFRFHTSYFSSLTGSSSQVSLSTEFGSQAMTIHCKSIAWVASLSTILLIRICPFKSIL